MTKYPKERDILELKPEITQKIDILIEKGLYLDYVDFLEGAIEAQFNLHEAAFHEVVKKKDFVIGLAHYSAKELEAIVARGEKLELKVLGGLKFSDDITPTLIEQSIDKINLAGILKAPIEVKTVLNKKRFTILGRRYSDFKRLES
ncbi:MAG: hypothetical protein ACFFDC_18205 [Promethearchaeota archaeon]